MGHYKSALENLDDAKHHLDQILGSMILGLGISDFVDMKILDCLSCTRIFLQAMSEDYAGALLEANKEVEKFEGWYYHSRALTRGGFVKRLCRDLPGAPEDLNTAYNGDYQNYMRDDIIEHRGYVKHLMRDDVGAKADAEAVQKLRFTGLRMHEESIACKSWGLYKTANKLSGLQPLKIFS